MALSGDRTFVGFGFGPIQAGLFLLEAYRSGNFARLVVAYRRPEAIARVRRAGGMITVNVAHPSRIEPVTFGPIEIYDVGEARDREALKGAIAAADELATALSSVSDYVAAAPGSVHRLLAAGLTAKHAHGGPKAAVYAAENRTQAAELLAGAVRGKLPAAVAAALPEQVQFLDTVIGKMSVLVTDPEQLTRQQLTPITPEDAGKRAFLVEPFNRILVSQVTLPGYRRGIPVFEEKADLAPFEEAKLYGHNAAHALLGYLGLLVGVRFVLELTEVPGVLELVRRAYLDEAGAALVRRHAGSDPLFTPEGFRAAAEDLLERMLNPNLQDTVARIGRDAPRKLGWNDRLVGTLRLVLGQGLTPRRIAFGTAAAVVVAGHEADVAPFLRELWAPAEPDSAPDPDEVAAVLELIDRGMAQVQRWRAAGFAAEALP